MHTGETSTISRHETLPNAYTQCCNAQNINVSFIWTDRYWAKTLKLQFVNKVEPVCVRVGTLTASVKKYCNSFGQLTSEVPLQKLTANVN